MEEEGFRPPPSHLNNVGLFSAALRGEGRIQGRMERDKSRGGGLYWNHWNVELPDGDLAVV